MRSVHEESSGQVPADSASEPPWPDLLEQRRQCSEVECLLRLLLPRASPGLPWIGIDREADGDELNATRVPEVGKRGITLDANRIGGGAWLQIRQLILRKSVGDEQRRRVHVRLTKVAHLVREVVRLRPEALGFSGVLLR